MFDQDGFDVRCEWGEQGVNQLAPVCDAVIVVDVLSFSTCVSIAVARGALVFPCRESGEAARGLARTVDAELAGHRGSSGFSLSPASLVAIAGGTRLVLPSPNGSALSLATGETPTLAGCLRNAAAVARGALQHGGTIAVIPAGERWRPDGSLRPAAEDWIGAGAIIRHLPGRWSPEARLAAEAFRSAAGDLRAFIAACSSGVELTARGFAGDVALAAALDVDDCAPLLVGGAYRRRPR